MPRVKLAKAKRINKLLRVITVVFMIYTAVNMVSIQYELNQKTKTADLLATKIAYQEKAISDLFEILDEGATDDAIISVAQKKLGLALPGERVVADVGSK